MTVAGRARALFARRLDSILSSLTGHGVEGVDWIAGVVPARPVLLNQAQIDALYIASPLCRRIVCEFAFAATSKPIEIEVKEGPEDAPALAQEALDDLHLMDALAEALRLDRKDGGSAIILRADDGQALEMPLDPGRLRRLAGFEVLDHQEIFPQSWDDDPASPRFGEVAMYTTAGIGRAAGRRIHGTRVIRFSGIEVSRRDTRSRNGRGYSVVDGIWPALRDYELARRSGVNLLKDAGVGVLTGAEIAAALAEDGESEGDAAENSVRERLRAIARQSSAYNTVALASGETYDRRSAPLAGVRDVEIGAMEHLAAAAGMSLTRLFGQPPPGLSTDNEAGRKNDEAQIDDLRRHKLRRPVAQIIALLFASKEGPTRGVVPAKWMYNFGPIAELSPKERAELEKLQADTDAVLIQSQVISPDEARTRVENAPRSPYTLDAERPEVEPEPDEVPDGPPMDPEPDEE